MRIGVKPKLTINYGHGDIVIDENSHLLIKTCYDEKPRLMVFEEVEDRYLIYCTDAETDEGEHIWVEDIEELEVL